MSTASLYKLIEFTKETKPRQRSVDFVPSSWIRWGPILGHLVTKFMPPPYGVEDSALLQSLVEYAAPAPDDWPSFVIDIRGEANTHNDAVKKLKVLQQKKYAYSTDSEGTAMNKALTITKEYKLKSLQKDDTAEEELWKVPTLEECNSSDECQTYSPDASSSSSSSDTKAGTTCRGSSKRKPANQNLDSGQKNATVKARGGKNITLDHVKVQENGASQKPVNNDCITKSTNKVTKGKHYKVAQPERHENDAVKNSKSLKMPLTKPGTSKRQEYNHDAAAGTTVLFDDVLKVINPDESPHPPSTDLEQTILHYFRSQSIQMTDILSKLKDIESLLKEKKINHLSEVFNTENFAEKYELDLPFKLLEHFQKFDDEFKNNKSLREKTKLNMWTCIESKSPVVNSIRNIFKKFMSRDVIQKFTAVKETASKLVFQRTRFCSCIQDVIVAEYKKNPKMSPITVKHFYKAVGSVINGSKDWDGHRTARAKQGPAVAKADGTHVAEGQPTEQ